MRMFVAAYPSESAVEDLEEFFEVRRAAAAFRWTDPFQWHLTLAFMADVPDRSLDDLVVRLAKAASKRRSMTASITGGGAFPHVGRAKVLWAGLETDHDELDRLATGCRNAAARAGAPASGERFTAHLTLARIGPPIEATKWVRLLDAYRGPQWTLSEIRLVASHLGEGPRRRPRHEVIATLPLAD